MQTLSVKAVENAAGYKIGTLRDWIVLVWLQPPSLEGLRALESALVNAGKTAAGRQMVFLTIIEPSAGKTISSEARAELERVLLATAEYVRQHIIVFQGDGLVAAIVRSVLSILALRLKRTMKKPSVVATVAEAVGVAEVTTPEENLDTIKALDAFRVQ